MPLFPGCGVSITYSYPKSIQLAFLSLFLESLLPIKRKNLKGNTLFSIKRKNLTDNSSVLGTEYTLSTMTDIFLANKMTNDQTLTLNIRIKKINKVTPIIQNIVSDTLKLDLEKTTVTSWTQGLSSGADTFLDGPLTNLTTKSGILFKVIDAPNFKADAPNFKADASNFKADASNFKADAPNFKADASNFKADVSNFKTDAPNFKVDAPNFKANEPEKQTLNTLIIPDDKESQNLKPIKQIKIKASPLSHIQLPVTSNGYETSDYDLLSEGSMESDLNAYNSEFDIPDDISIDSAIDDDTQRIITKLSIFGKYFWVGCDIPYIYDLDTVEKIGIIKPNLDIEWFISEK